MLFAGVRLPDQIRVALEENRLVVFAGAGVSLPPPSCLPNFNKLACQITGLGVRPGKEDHDLGKIARDKKTDVHSAAARILYHPNTRPTELHKQILRVFGAADKVRVVTTNFDDHFSSAARSVFRRDTVTECYAPALPLGDDFQGIVYLHGSAKVNPRAMVLTDKDFGAAYLTRGWAREFLISLFSKYTVLFVGYSHNDVTTSYLARGLNQAVIKPRWALQSSDIPSEAREHWEHLEISVEQYPVQPANKENPHRALTEFFTQWAELTKESIFDRAKKIKAIAAGLPPESLAVSEYLEYCLHNSRLAQEFCEAIRHPAWVGWLQEKNYFKAFFCESTGRELQPHELVIAQWLSGTLRKKFPEVLLALIEKHHQRMSPQFVRVFAHTLWVKTQKAPDRMFATWVSVLLAQEQQSLPSNICAYILQNCQLPAHAGIALRLLELLTTPEIRLRKHFNYSELQTDASDNKANKTTKRASRKVDYEITWPRESHHWLSKAWDEVFRQHIAELSEPLVLLVTKQLVFAHTLLRGLRQASDSFDVLSWDRPSIAPHEQNRTPLHACLSILIDIARDVLIHWNESNPARGNAQIQLWWTSKVPLLRRLAVHGISLDTTRSADDKIEWLLSNDLLFEFGMKKEVFDILEIAYPHVDKNTKQRVLRVVERGRLGNLRIKVEPEIRAYERFNLLVWLCRVDPECQLTKAAIAKVQKAFPKFVEREHPNFDHWFGSGDVSGSNEKCEVGKILSEPPGHFIDAIPRGSSLRMERWRYLGYLPGLFSRDRKWGEAFIDALSKRDAVDAEVWQAGLSAWKETIKTNEDWEWILDLMGNLPENPEVFPAVAKLISQTLWQRDSKPNESVISKAAVLMDKAWATCSKVEAAPDDRFHDWLDQAIQNEGGWIADFWLNYCSYLRQRGGAHWEGIPAALKGKMVEALNGKNRVKVSARIVLTPSMNQLLEWDPEFAVDNLLPLLDWQRDAVVAQQTWSVLLSYRKRTSVETERQLLPYYKQFAERMTTILKEATENAEQFNEQALRNFGFYLAGLAMRCIDNPVETGFFREFLPRLPERVRGYLAIGMLEFFKITPPEKIREVWGAWLREYLDLRLVGVPLALSFEETKTMAEWCLHFRLVFSEAVKRILKMPLKNVFAYGIIDKLKNDPVVEECPKEACAYVVAMLKADEYQSLHEGLSLLHDKFKQKIPGTSEFREFQELLYLRGWGK